MNSKLSLQLCLGKYLLIISALSACQQTTKQAQEAIKPQLSSGIAKENMNLAIPAQEDFYHHINGQWLKKHTIPDDKADFGTFTVLQELSKKRVKAILQKWERDPNKISQEQMKALTFYKNFLETDKIDKLAWSPIKGIVDRIDNIDNDIKLAQFFAHSQQLGIASPFQFYVDGDRKNPSQNRVYFYQSGLGLPDRDYFFNKKNPHFESVRKAYKSHIQGVLKHLRIKNPKSTAELLYKLEESIAKIQLSRTELRDRQRTYNPFTSQKIARIIKDFPWQSYIEASQIIKHQGQLPLIVQSPKYFKQLSALFKSTPLKLWKVYFKWHTFSSYAPFLSKTIRNEHFAFYETRLKGVEKQKVRSELALEYTNLFFADVIGKEYVKLHFNQKAMNRMTAMVKNLQVAFKHRIQKLQWMSDESKKRALKKLSLFKPKIGHTNKWEDYSALKTQKSKLIDNIIQLEAFAYNKLLEDMGNEVDPERWHMSPQTVNAYYNVGRNEIVFPAAILQLPFFNLEADDAVNYGGIGAVIGHEMSHGFDDQGSKFDGHGRMQNWWQKSDYEQFTARSQDLVKQYSSYQPLKGHFINGEFTLGENIGDLGGLNIALEAYKLKLASKPEEAHKTIDGYTPIQRFFIGWAQVWARNYRDQELKRRLVSDPHSPSKYRVNGILSNMPEFMEAFSVKPNHSMYKTKKDMIKIW